MNLQIIGALDVTIVLSRLRLQYWDHFKGDGEIDIIHLMDDNGPTAILRGEKGWKSAASFLNKLANEAAPFLGGKPAEFGRVWIERLAPGVVTPWRKEPVSQYLLVRICLATPPGAWVYAGGSGLELQPGLALYVNEQAHHCDLNMGAWPRIHLCCEVRRPDATVADEEEDDPELDPDEEPEADHALGADRPAAERRPGRSADRAPPAGRTRRNRPED